MHYNSSTAFYRLSTISKNSIKRAVNYPFLAQLFHPKNKT